MPNPITCHTCICNQTSRGYAVLLELIALCRDKRADGTCQIIAAYQGVIEGEFRRVGNDL